MNAPHVHSALRTAFDALVGGRALDVEQAEMAFGAILDSGQSDPDAAPDPMIAGFLTALKIRGESAAELTGAARAMLSRARKLELKVSLADIVGTGGDGAGTFNVSTGAAIVAAAAGVAIAKHGNRAVTGRVGSADVLEAVGVRIDPGPEVLKRCLREAGFCFIFAPAYHPVMARLAPMRRALGIRTIFNLLGPLCNPARPRRMLAGVSDVKLVRPMAETLAALGIEHALVVSGRDGVDEISLAAPTAVAELRAEAPIREYEIAPEKFGFARANAAEVSAADANHSAAILKSAFSGAKGAPHDILALNAGAGLYVAGAADSISAGVARARQVLASGRALLTLEKLAAASGAMKAQEQASR